MLGLSGACKGKNKKRKSSFFEGKQPLRASAAGTFLVGRFGPGQLRWSSSATGRVTPVLTFSDTASASARPEIAERRRSAFGYRHFEIASNVVRRTEAV